MLKVCSKCGLEKELNDFYKRKVSKDGHRSECKECCNKYTNENRFKYKDFVSDYYNENKEYFLEKSKKYYKENKDIILDNRKKYYKENIIEEKLRNKKWNENNKEHIKEYNYNYKKERRENDKLFKVTCDIRSLIRISIKNRGYTKTSKTYKILGCSFEYFKKYIEDKFEPWMTWENHGSYTGNKNETWQLDHIIPISSATTEEEIIKLNHYTNFQPLCSFVNLVEKKDKLNYGK